MSSIKDTCVLIVSCLDYSKLTSHTSDRSSYPVFDKELETLINSEFVKHRTSGKYGFIPDFDKPVIYIEFLQIYN